MSKKAISSKKLFPNEIIENWIKNGSPYNYKKGTVISSSLNSINNVYIVKKGQASILRTHLDGKECIVGLVRENEFLNIYDIFSTLKSNMSFKAITDLDVAAINKETIINYTLSNPEQSLALLNYFSDSLQEMSEMLSHIAYGKVEERIVFLFKKISEDNPANTDWFEINKVLTHQDIASMIGSTRETVTIVIHKLTSRGYIKHSKNIIWVNKNYINNLNM